MPALAVPRSRIPSSTRIVAEGEPLPYVDVATPLAAARVFFQGAQVTHWQPSHMPQPVLWLSAHSHFRAGRAIRGGVPVCYPWFGPHPSEPGAPAHGLARLTEWTLIDASESSDGTTALAFAIETAPATSPAWPQRSRVVLGVSIGHTLRMDLTVENRDETPFSFEEALHTYFAVDDVARIGIAGLEGREYLDKVEGFAHKRQPQEPIRFSGETDRVYLDTTAACRIADPGFGRTIVVAPAGSRSTVVWNPWSDRARAFTDFGDEEWRRMVCVETANVRDAAIRLEPGASHTMRAEISASPA